MKKLKNKNKKPGVIRRTVKSMVNVRRWLAFDEVVTGGKVVGSAAKRVFTARKATHHETFAEAVARLNLTAEDIQQRQQGFLRLALIYLVMALAMFGYAVYIFSTGYIITGILCLVLTALILLYAYKEHFWYTQVKHRKFGCTFKDWWAFTFNKNRVAQ